MAWDLSELIEVARQACSVEMYEQGLFECIGREVGFDVAFCVRNGAMGPHAPGFDAQVRRATRGRWGHYRRDFSPLVEGLIRGRAVVDREALGSAGLQRTSVYREIMRPHRGHSSLLLSLGSEGESAALIVLGRKRVGFRDWEIDLMLRAQAVLTVGEFSLRRFFMAVEPDPRLSVREQDLVRCLRLGYTNREAALALGSSANTVRNQLVRLFDKLGASTRAEAVARSYELGENVRGTLAPEPTI